MHQGRERLNVSSTPSLCATIIDIETGAAVRRPRAHHVGDDVDRAGEAVLEHVLGKEGGERGSEGNEISLSCRPDHKR